MRRRLVTVSALSLAGALFVACGDDKSPATGIGGSGGTSGNAGMSGSSGDAGMSGSSGSAGMSGTSGNAGTSGSAGEGGSAGTAGGSGGYAGVDGYDWGDAGDGGPADAATADAGPPPPCTGCLELRVPFTAPSQSAFFQLTFAARDLSDTLARFRLRALLLDETGGLFVQTFAIDSDGDPIGTSTFAPITLANFTDTETFANIDLDIPGISAAGFDDTAVVTIGVQVGSSGAFVGPATAVLLLDSITYTGSGGLPDLDFTPNAQGVVVGASSLQTAELLHH
jgi:hypothetical protein